MHYGWVRSVILSIAIIAAVALPAASQSFSLDIPLGADSPLVTVSAAASHTTVVPGQTFHVAVKAKIREGVWLYSPAPRGKLSTPRPLEIVATAGEWSAGQTMYPRPQWHTIDIAGIVDSTLTYDNTVVFYIPITVPDKPGADSGGIQITLTGQTCDTAGCYDAEERVVITVQVGPTPIAADPETYPARPTGLKTAAQWRTQAPSEPGTKAATVSAGAPGADLTTWMALALALAAGVTLNVMPCVLPVIPIKIMSLLQQARQSRRRSITLGTAYAAGILSFFLLGGAISMIARVTSGSVFNLNEPFKVPAFIIAMALLLVGSALWLFNVFTLVVGGSLAGGAPRQGHLGSIGMGFVTAVLATPCSGPVLAAVFGWSQGRPAWASGAVFAALGVGMAAPHAILAGFPGLLERLPKPGIWMERLKQGMAFILLLVAVWLISTLGSVAWVGWVTAYAVVFGACLWMAGTWVNFNTPAVKRRTVRVVAMIIAVAAGASMLPRPAASAIPWRPFDAAAVDAAAATGEVVLVKFTADTCTICKILDLRVYNRKATAAALAERGVVAFVADTTQRDYPANIVLVKQLGEPGPPVTLIYGPAVGEPIRLRGLFSRDELLAALDRARGES